MTRRALVTGAAGFVGAVLTRRLALEGHDVHALVSPSPAGKKPWRLTDLDLPLYPVDLADGEAVQHAVAKIRPEWVFHLAAHGGYSWQRDFPRMIATNVLGCIHLVDACLRAGFESFVHAGSSSEYGLVDHAPLESEPCRPESDYAVTKLSATLYCRAVAKRENRNLCTLRLYSVYGPFEEPARFVPTLAVHGIEKKLPRLVESDVARDFVFVDDAVEAFLLAARAPSAERGAVFNVGTGKQTSIAEAVEVARAALGIDEEPRFASMPNRSWDTTSWVANADKIGRELGFDARTSFADGFRRLVAWLREDPARLDFYRSST
jgi:dolichol-phosphate mannosyltransferase